MVLKSFAGVDSYETDTTFRRQMIDKNFSRSSGAYRITTKVMVFPAGIRELRSDWQRNPRSDISTNLPGTG